MTVSKDGEIITEGVEFESSNEDVVEINEDNELEAVSDGKATIKAKYDGLEATADIRVIIPIKSMSFTTTNKTIRVGKDLQMKLKLTPSNASTDTLTYTSSDEEIASTYSGVTGARSVSDIYKKDMSKMSAADLVKELNAYEQKYKNNTADEFHKYELYNFEKLNKLISKVNDGMSLDSQWREWAELYPGYFDKDVNASDQPLLFCASI